MKLDKIYIVHYTPLIERRKYLEKTLPKFNIPFEFRFRFDRESKELNDNTLIDVSENNLKKRNIVLSEMGFSLQRGAEKPALKAIILEHYHIFKDFINSDLENILVLEDDAIFDENFFNVYEDYLKLLPSDYDVLYIGSGCNLQLPFKSDKIIELHPNRYSKCADSYIISKKAAINIYNNCLPLYCNWDWELNYQQQLHKMNVYWVSNPLVYQGSEHGQYNNSY